MSKFLYGIWNDFKKNILFNMIMVVEILVVILLFGNMLGGSRLENVYYDLYDSKTSDLTLINFSMFDELDDYLGQEGFTDYAATSMSVCDDGDITFVNNRATEWFKVDHSGKWFSGEQGEYKEALVSRSLKNKYKVGKNYELKNVNGENNKIVVIGYLDRYDMSISLSSEQYANVYGTSKFLICDENAVKSNIAPGIVTRGASKEFYLNKYNLDSSTMGESFEEYAESTKVSRYRNSYILAIIFLLLTTCVVCNSVFRVERDIKQNMLKFVVGESNRNIIARESIKNISIFTVPFLTALVIVAVSNISTAVSGKISFIAWDNFFIASSVALGVYVLTTIFSLLRVIKAKPLNELRRR